jgi:hypothetical protein
MTKSISRPRATAAAALAAAAWMAAGAVQAAPYLEIVGADKQQEVTGDPGGTNYNVPAGTLNGPGLPTALGNWPDTAPNGNGFAQDSSFNNSVGISGYHTAYLFLSESANVTFQFMGKGDASQANTFLLDRNSDGDYADAGERMFLGGTTTACPMLGGKTPVCDQTAGGFAVQNQYTAFVNVAAGGDRIKFAYLTGNGVLLENSGAGNGNPDPHTSQLPGYFLGMDPYLATAPYQTRGNAVYAGLTDLPDPGDHDFQDLGVRISVVPEPGSMALVLAACLGLAVSQRRNRRG